MNELLIGLLAVGALVLVGLAVYNRIEERRFSKRLEEDYETPVADPFAVDSFAERPPSFTITSPLADTRREPQLDAPASAAEPAWADPEPIYESEPGAVEPYLPAEPVEEPAPPAPAPRAQQAAGESPCDDVLDYCLQIDGNGVHGSVFADAVTRCRSYHRPVRWWGLPTEGRQWAELQPWRDARYEHVLVTVQLADRNGATTADDLAVMKNLVEPLAHRNHLSLNAGDIAGAARRAQALDALCVDVDLLIGLNVVAVTEGGELAQSSLLKHAQAVGMKLAADGSYQLEDAAGDIVFQLVNHDAEAFESGRSTQGVTLQFDVPRVADGVNAFGRMVELGDELARVSGGRLVDDNMRLLTPGGIDKIRAQLARVYQRMEAGGIPAGSPRALRLFA